MSDAVIGLALPIATLAVLAGASWWRVRAGRSSVRGVGITDSTYDSRSHPGHGWDGPRYDTDRAAQRPPAALHDARTERVLITAFDDIDRPAARPRNAPVTVLRAAQRPVRHELWPLAGGPAVALPTGTPVEVGRAPGSGLRIDLPAVSYRHARLRPVGTDGSRIVVEDCDSTNGTAVNGRRIVGAVSLASGDVVRFGGTQAPEFEYRRVAAWSAVPVEVTA